MPNNDHEQTLVDVESEEAILGQGEFSIPGWLRCIAVLVLSVVLIGSIALFLMYVFGLEKGLEPSKLGLPSLIIFSVLGIIVFLIPWEDYGLRIRKFGPFEFQEILSTQSKEHTDELVELRNRIQQLENQEQISGSKKDDNPVLSGEGTRYGAPDQSILLQELLLKFLKEFRRWAFSPTRILNWGAGKPGFSELNEYSVKEIRRTLQDMTANGTLETRISRKGNTLYRIPR